MFVRRAMPAGRDTQPHYDAHPAQATAVAGEEDLEIPAFIRRKMN
jgi:hypothetical protein